ncbi:SLAM family member 7 isoform X3 [Manis javanica]|uniref:SLAM family member 7 isoform X3 n=1 Tax=Manis javanica TaxID=9974 RepID=UPI003C6CF24D
MLGPSAHSILIFLLYQLAEHVSKPQVTMGLQNNENGTCVTNLTCFMEQAGEDVTYSWKSLGQASNESYDGSTLPISWKLGKKDMTFICTARNPISSNYSNPISVWKLCEGPAGVPNVMVWSLLGVFFLLGALVLLPAIWIMRRGKRKESYFRGKSSKHTLFHCANTQKGGETPLSALIARHTKAICP